MDRFKTDQDLFVTKEGRAQDRIPNDLSPFGTQQGTVLNATMVNGVVFELVNAIQGMGEKPDRGKENQLSTILTNWFVYQNIGKINSWICPKINIPKTEAVLDGSTLNPEDYQDNLEALLKVFPSWASGGKVKLPDFNNNFQRFQTSRTPGHLQGHTIQPLTVGNPTFTADDITMPGKVVYEAYNDARNSSAGTAIVNILKVSQWATGSTTFELVRKPETEKKITISVSGDTSLKGAITDSAKETRPKNFAVLMSVVVGIPKAVPA